MEHDSRANKDMEKDFNGESSDLEYDDSIVLQSVRLRHSSVLADSEAWRFVASELRFVLYSGTFLWLIYLLSLAI